MDNRKKMAELEEKYDMKTGCLPMRTTWREKTRKGALPIFVKPAQRAFSRPALGGLSCYGACRRPRVGMARRRLTKVGENEMTNEISRYVQFDLQGYVQFDLQVKTVPRHSGGGTPHGKPPCFVVARQRQTHIWTNICAMRKCSLFAMFRIILPVHPSGARPRVGH